MKKPKEKRLVNLITKDEKEAIDYGIALLNGKYRGESDFDKGMRLLQNQLKEVAVKSLK